jgi:RNA polymerase sigma factor (sigma-70 family)
MIGGLPPSRESDPAALICRVMAGDRSAENDLVSLFQRSVLLHVRWRVRDQEVSRELTDDVLMAVLHAVRTGRVQDAAKLSAFVRGTARNLSNNYLRASSARPVEEPLDPEVAVFDPAPQIEHREEWTAVRLGLERLGHMDRQIMLMTVVDGFKPAQIARYLGLTAEVVRTRKARAVRKLLACSRPHRPAPRHSRRRRARRGDTPDPGSCC